MKLYLFRLRTLLIAAGAAIAAAVAITAVSTAITAAGKDRELPIYSVKTDGSIALTFNCAWGNEDIDDILSTLSRYDCKATFFIVGDWAERFPESVQKIVSEGHEIGSHSYDHKDYTKLSGEVIEEDIAKADKAISDACGVTPHLLRVPSGAYNDDVIRACRKAGKKCIQWSVDSIDYSAASAEEIYERVMSKASDGSIILMHTGTQATAISLPRILDGLCGSYTLRTVSALTDFDSFTIDNTGMLIPD